MDGINEIIDNYSEYSCEGWFETNCKNCANELKENGYSKKDVFMFFIRDGIYDEKTDSGIWDADFALTIIENM